MTSQSADGRRWVGVGSSDVTDATAAGIAATTAALLGRDDAALVVAFASDSYDAKALVDGMRRVAPDVPLIGCTTAGEIDATGAGDDRIVVTVFGGPGFVASTTVQRQVSDDLHLAGQEAARAVATDATDPLRTSHPHDVLLLLTDGLSGNQQEIVRGAYATLGAATPIVGGCAGDGLRMEATQQFHDDEVVTDAIVAARLSSDAPFGVGVRHGWEPVGERMLVTESGENEVHRIDGRPALDVYLEALDAPAEVGRDAATFTRFAMTHPLGMDRRRTHEVRFVRGADLETRSLLFIAEVPQGELVQLLRGDAETVLAAADAACSAATLELDGGVPIGLVAFDCIARRGVLGQGGIDREVVRITDRFPGIPVAGFYTYGEFARVQGSRGFHNQTLVVLAVS